MNDNIDIETDRLKIRSFTKNDLNDVFEYLSDEIVMKYIEPVFTYEQVIEFINRTGIENKLIFAIEIKNEKKVIGHLIFHEYKKDIYELGWIINRNYWNNGYAIKVSKTIIKFGFNTLNIKKIIGETDEENKKSIKIFEKIGMKFVGKNKDGLIEYEINNNENIIK